MLRNTVTAENSHGYQYLEELKRKKKNSLSCGNIWDHAILNLFAEPRFVASINSNNRADFETPGRPNTLSRYVQTLAGRVHHHRETKAQLTPFSAIGAQVISSRGPSEGPGV